MQRLKTLLCAATCSIVALSIAACGDANAGAGASEAATAAPRPGSGRASALAAAAVTPQRMSEGDRLALKMARTACLNRDFQQFFTALASSRAALRQYSANSIELATLDAKGTVMSSSHVAAGVYDTFPVRLVDFYFKPARPRVGGDDDEYLDVQFNQSQSQVYSVEWARVHYDGKSVGGDDLGNMIDRGGKVVASGMHPEADGQLLFAPTDDCWKLQSDTRWRR